MKSHLLLLGMVGVCLSAPNLNAQTLSDSVTDSVLVEGRYRSFVYPKPNPSARFTDLVFILHGSNGDGQQMRQSVNQQSQVEAKARDSHTLLIYPNAWKRYWNECRKSSPAEANRLDVNEQAFFQAMIQYAQQRFGVNPEHVSAMGVSGGGHMSYKLAMTMPGTFRAIAAFIANLPDSTNMDCAGSGKALPVMIINGTADPINPYGGGEVNLGTMKMGAVQSTDRTFHYWAQLAHYTGNPNEETLPDTNPNDGKTIVRYTYRAAGKPEIVLLKVIGGKHDLPSDIDGFSEALAFLQRQLTR